jgi:hypothetical protein
MKAFGNNLICYSLILIFVSCVLSFVKTKDFEVVRSRRDVDNKATNNEYFVTSDLCNMKANY